MESCTATIVLTCGLVSFDLTESRGESESSSGLAPLSPAREGQGRFIGGCGGRGLARSPDGWERFGKGCFLLVETCTGRIVSCAESLETKLKQARRTFPCIHFVCKLTFGLQEKSDDVKYITHHPILIHSPNAFISCLHNMVVCGEIQ